MSTPLGGAAVALLIGLLIGLERERGRRPEEPLFAGIRTFPLFSIAGYLGALAGLHGLPLALPALILSVGALAAVAYARSPADHVGVTTEAATLVATLMGAAVGFGQAPVAIALAVAVALLLTLKERLHTLAGAVSAVEIMAILKFAVVALIVLPLLPDRPMGPYGALEPQRIGLVVVILCGVSLVAYLLVRLVGGRAGWPLAGLLGGLVSSTATTLSFSSRARESSTLVRPLALGILLASTILYVRGTVLALLFDRALGLHLLPRLGALLVLALALGGLQFRRLDAGLADASRLGNPVELGRAVTLAAVFAAVLVGARAAQAEMGTAGLWGVGAVGGLVDVDSVLVAVARVRQQGLVDVPGAAGAFLLATLTNLFFKAGAVTFVGGRDLARRVLPLFAILASATAAVILFWP